MAICSAAPAVQPNNFLPCRIDSFEDFSGNRTGIYCSKLKSSRVLKAFRSNTNDTNDSIKELNLGDLPDMTDSMLEEIFQIAAVTLRNVDFIYLVNMPLVTKVPSTIGNFTKLQNIYVEWMDGIEILPAGSLSFSSNSLSEISVRHNNFLKIIEPQAFQGDLLITTKIQQNFQKISAKIPTNLNKFQNKLQKNSTKIQQKSQKIFQKLQQKFQKITKNLQIIPEKFQQKFN